MAIDDQFRVDFSLTLPGRSAITFVVAALRDHGRDMTNNDAACGSKKFAGLYALKVKYVCISSLHPRTNGKIEASPDVVAEI